MLRVCKFVSRSDLVLIRKRAEYCFESTVSEKRTHWASLSSGANSVSSARSSVSLLWHTNNRLRRTHWVCPPELGEGRKTHWVRCLKPYSPKPYSARFRLISFWMLISDHALDFLFYLVLQACISFCSVSDKSGASLFLPCLHKMPLLMYL